MTEAEFIALLKGEVKGLTAYLADADYINAIGDVVRETGWVVTTEDTFQIFWFKQRAKRHLFFYLQSESAHKFKYKQINLQNRFSHYDKLVVKMDKDWAAIQEARPEKFANVSALKLFGTKIDAGFRYVPQTGEDDSYSQDSLIKFGPKESD